MGIHNEVAVFTKYDKPPSKVLVPIFPNREIEPISLCEGSCDVGEVFPPILVRCLKPVKIRQGLEGVIFVTYG